MVCWTHIWTKPEFCSSSDSEIEPVLWSNCQRDTLPYIQNSALVSLASTNYTPAEPSLQFTAQPQALPFPNSSSFCAPSFWSGFDLCSNQNVRYRGQYRCNQFPSKGNWQSWLHSYSPPKEDDQVSALNQAFFPLLQNVQGAQGFNTGWSSGPLILWCTVC